MILRFALVSITILLFQVTMAQSFTIKGAVRDSVEGGPVKSASVQVFDSNNKLIFTDKTNDTGNFFIEVPNTKRPAFIILSSIGYQNKKIKVAFSDLTVYESGNILLLPSSYSLAAVVVEGKKAPVSFTVDRQVYKLSQYGNAANGTAVDAIRNLPSVNVNGQGEIFLGAHQVFWYF
ncbi:carboxypeptidase-like regulatory domain-containing protein [Niabella ginsengisoli]|uniref:Carboxypeptidase-like regulatory domain-containing protein n=1 Tax=Niabella ginsengisoli TaxID=522298 RepID=A0ABS9SKG2_9BACT|nr:carboxypeptidase-like regulatory domain-containing protein [Niabella ginsengisoli]MCH5598867.1 carboxypeptidase-like regulatory domain-containing protein [Niabella ginsengisoli]